MRVSVCVLGQIGLTTRMLGEGGICESLKSKSNHNLKCSDSLSSQEYEISTYISIIKDFLLSHQRPD